MIKIPKTVEQRIKLNVKKYKEKLVKAIKNDLKEDDTADIVRGFMSEALGWKRHTDMTSEHKIKGKYCDLVVSLDDKPKYVVEVKSVGTELREQHITQAVDYVAHKGLQVALLTNFRQWQAYSVTCNKSVTSKLIYELDLEKLNLRHSDKSKDIEFLYCLSKEGVKKNKLGDFRDYSDHTSKYFLSALIYSDSIMKAIQKELKKINNSIKVSTDEIREKLEEDIFKVAILEDEEFKNASKQIKRLHNKNKKPKKAVKVSQSNKSKIIQQPSIQNSQPKQNLEKLVSKEKEVIHKIA